MIEPMNRVLESETYIFNMDSANIGMTENLKHAFIMFLINFFVIKTRLYSFLLILEAISTKFFF